MWHDRSPARGMMRGISYEDEEGTAGIVDE